MHPFREPFHKHLIVALARSGRRSEALAAYRRQRELLVRELGIEPARDVQDIHQLILSGEMP